MLFSKNRTKRLASHQSLQRKLANGDKPINLLTSTHHCRLCSRSRLLSLLKLLLLAPRRAAGRGVGNWRTGYVCLLFLSSGLRTGTCTAPSGAASTPGLALEAARAGSTLAVLSLALEASTSTVGRSAPAAAVVATSIGIGLRATLLDNDVLAIDSVGVGGYCCVVTGSRLELHECAVLQEISIAISYVRGFKNNSPSGG